MLYFNAADRRNDLQTVIQQLKAQGRFDVGVNFKDQYGSTLIEYALIQGDLPEMQKLINHGAIIPKDLLFQALKLQNVEATKILFGNFNPQLAWWQEYRKTQPTLTMDVREHYSFWASLIAQLPEFSDVGINFLKQMNILDDYTVLRDFVIKTRCIEETDEKYPGEDLNTRNTFDYLTMYFPCALNDEKAVDGLLSDNDIDLNAEFWMPFGPFDAPQKRSLLQVAILRKENNFPPKLLEQGADPEQEDNHYQNSLFSAVISQNIPMIKVLLEKGVALTTNFEGQSVLHIAAEIANIEVLELLLSNDRVRALVNQKDFYGITPLDYAARNKLVLPISSTSTSSSIPPSEIIAIDQRPLIRKLLYMLELKNQSTEYLNEYGVCNGLGFLKAIYDELGYDDDLKKILTFISKWDGKLESLQDTNIVADLKSGPYVNADDLLNQFINDILTFVSPYGGMLYGPVLGIKPDDRAGQLALITSKDIITTPLYEVTAVLTTEAQLREHLELISKMPGAKFEIRSPGHATAGTCTRQGEIDFFDPEQRFWTAPTTDIDLVVSRVHKYIFRHTPDKMDIQILVYEQPSSTSKIMDLSQFKDPQAYKSYYEASPNQFTPLHLAVLLKDYSAIQEFLNISNIDLNLQNFSKISALNLAIKLGDVRAVELLLSSDKLQVTLAEMKVAMQEKYFSIPNNHFTELMADRTWREKAHRSTVQEALQRQKIEAMLRNRFLTPNTAEKQAQLKNLEKMNRVSTIFIDPQVIEQRQEDVIRSITQLASSGRRKRFKI